MPDYSVYLSSTFRDLEPYRAAVMQSFNDNYTDFRIKGMENYTANTQPPMDVCLRDVQKCDIYILLLGKRYGHIPDEPLNTKQKSITELEYDEAIKYRKEVLVFTLDEQIESLEDDDADPGLLKYKKDQLQEFRKKALTHHTSPRPFRDPMRLVVNIAMSILNWKNKQADPKDRIYDERIKYCCDRTPQFLTYRNHVTEHDSNFHVFISRGHREGLGANLVNRCAIFSLMMHENDIHEITLNEIFRENYDEGRALFLHQLMIKMPSLEKLFSDQPEVTINGIEDDGIFLLIPTVKFLEEKRVDFLFKILDDLHRQCKTYRYPYKIYLFIHIEDENDNDCPVIDYIKGKVNEKADSGYITMLDRFSSITGDEVRTWIGTYINKDAGIKEDIMDNYFDQLPDSFSMREAEKRIRRLLTQIRNKENDIMRMLNIF